MLRGYTAKLYPNKEQAELLGKHFGCVRWVYNKLIEINQKRYHRTGKSMSGYDMQNMLPGLKRQYPWLAEVAAQPLQIACHNLGSAYTGFFRGQSRYPKRKKRGMGNSFTCINNSRIDSRHICVTKIGKMRYRGGDRPEGQVKRITIRERAGKYYASVLIDTPGEEPATCEPSHILGLDLGLSHTIVTSDGQVFDAPRPMRESRAELKIAQQVLSRRQKGSARRGKARMRVARLHEQVANQRKDFNHKVSRILVGQSENQALAVENLNIKGMMSNHKLAFHIADSGWGQFLMFLRYKATTVGKQVLEVGRFFPSSKTCSACGIVCESLPLDVRRWTCECGTTHNRDINAAINIAYEAGRNFVSDRGGGISPEVLRPTASAYETSSPGLP